MTRIAALAGLLLAFCSAASAATVYKWRDASGTLHMTTDEPPTGAEIVSRMTVVKAPARAPKVAPPWPEASTGSPAAADSRVEIVMYATSRCPWCRKARQFFASRGVTWRELDIEDSAAADREFKAHGGLGVPLIFINGSRVSGWDPGRIGALLDQALARR